MKKLKFNKKIIIPIILGVVLIIGCFALFPINTKAVTNTTDAQAIGSLTGPGAEIGAEIGKMFFRFLGTVLLLVGNLLLNVGVKFFQAMLTTGFNGHSEIAQIGWKVSKDIANMFFILFMVVIAFGTILRIERYGAKQLLPKIIIIALLINFSLVLCYVLIDFTNIAANYFITNAQIDANGNKVPLSQVFLDGLKIPNTLTANVCELYLADRDNCATLFANGDPMDIPACQYNAQHKYEQCTMEMQNIQNTATQDEDLLHVIASQIGSAIVIFIAAFIMFAGAILLVIRSVAIWFLVIISPLAFICYILPSLRRNWENWLTQFTRWCIFAPAYAFFIWLAAKICTQQSLERIGALQENMFTDRAAMVNQFFSDPQYLFSFIFVAGFLIAALITANKLGIYGAGMAIHMGKRWGGAVTGWAKKQTVGRAKERAGGGLDRARGAAVSGMGKLFGDTKLGRSLTARGAIAKQSAAQRAYNKRYATRLSMMSREDTLKELEKASGTQKLLAARTAQNRGFIRGASNKQAAEAISAFTKFGDIDSARKLEEIKPLAVTDRNKRREAIERGKLNGSYKQWDENTFSEDLNLGAQVMEDLREILTPAEFQDAIKSWSTPVRNAALSALKRNFSTVNFDELDIEGKKNIARRKAYAKATNDFQAAFLFDNDPTETNKFKGNPMPANPQIDLIARDYVESSNAEDINKFTPEDSVKLVAKYMNTKQVEQLGFGISGKNKDIIVKELELLIAGDQKDRQEVLNAIKESSQWGGKPKTPPTP